MLERTTASAGRSLRTLLWIMLSYMRNKSGTLIACLLLIAMPAYAQSGLPGETPTAAPRSYWKTVGSSESFPTPDAACRKQHEIYNPNATYEAPVYRTYSSYGCKWKSRQHGGPPNSSTVLPTIISLNCPSGYSLLRTGVRISVQ